MHSQPMQTKNSDLKRKEKLNLAKLHCRLVAKGIRVLDADRETITTERDIFSSSEGRFVPVIEVIPSTSDGVSLLLAKMS